MKNDDTHSPNWGERRVNQKNQRKWLVSSMVVFAMIIFGFGSQHILDIGQKIAPASEAANAGSLVWAVSLMATFGVISLIMWREIDELSRKIAINASAIAGVASIVMLLILQAAGDMIDLKNPLSTVLIITMVIMIVAILIQKVGSYRNITNRVNVGG